MDGPDFIPKFFNPEMPPSPGGWHYWLDPETKRFPVFGHSPQEVFDQILRYAQNNAIRGFDPVALWRQLWGYWCSLEPNRCGAPKTPPTQPALPPKEVWGPILWKTLNWLAVNYTDGTLFRDFVNAMYFGNLIPCQECRDHFGDIISDNPISGVVSQKTACQWVNRVHNRVNSLIGKRTYPYAQGIAEYGFPL